MLAKAERIEAAAANNNNTINLTTTSATATNKPISRLAQLLPNNGTSPPGHDHQENEPLQLSQTAAAPDQQLQQATGADVFIHRTFDQKIWLYFERADKQEEVRCLLCSREGGLFECKLANDDPEKYNSPNHLLLLNHLKTKHEIDDSLIDLSSRTQNQAFENKSASSSRSDKQHKSRFSESSKSTKTATNSNHSHNNDIKHNNNIDEIQIGNTNSTSLIASRGNSGSTSQNKRVIIATAQHSTTNMTNTTKQLQQQQQRHHRLPTLTNSSSANAKKSSAKNDYRDLRRNLDLFDYDDLSKASLKPLPNSSLSRNLFERLNQLSSPVTRKLKFWNKKSFQVNQYDPCFKVIYLGNLGVQFWSKDESCLEKPLNTLWNNYLVNMKTEIVMRLTICNSGLKAITRQHGLTQYWSNRLVYCCSHKNYPKIFSWIYRHEGKKMRQELRCHAVFCSSPERASKMVSLLNQRLTCALEEFKREKKSRGQPPRIVAKCQDSLLSSSCASASLLQATLPRTVPLRRQILAKGAANFRPPLERSKSAPKLTSIREEDYELEEEEDEEEEDQRLAQAAAEKVGGACQEGFVAVSRRLNGDINRAGGAANDRSDSSHDELEYEQSFDDRDEDEDDGESHSDFDDDALLGRSCSSGDASCGRADADSASSNTPKGESLMNEETSNGSGVYAAACGDISYDNIIATRHHVSNAQERPDSRGNQTTPPILLKSAQSSSAASSASAKSASPQNHFLLRRLSLRRSSMNQNESLHSDRTESMSDAGGQLESESQLASIATASTLNSCHINSSNNNNNNNNNSVHNRRNSTGTETPSPMPHENQANGASKANHNHVQQQTNSSLAHQFGQIKL